MVNIVPSVNSKPWNENLKERDKPEDLEEKCIMSFKMDLKKQDNSVDWIQWAKVRGQ